MNNTRRKLLFGGDITLTPYVTFHPTNASPDLYLYKNSIEQTVDGFVLNTIPSSWGTTIEGSIELCEGFVTIGNDCFKNKTALTSVFVPTTLTYIGNNAFLGCTNLTQINGLSTSNCKSIGISCFAGCSALSSISFPEGLTALPSGGHIAGGVFSNCTSLTSITLPSTLTSIGSYFAYGCTSLSSINIPNSVTSIGNFAFQNSGLTSITLPNSVTQINTQLFQNCSSLVTVVLGNRVTNISSAVFRNCSALRSITCTTTNRPSLGSQAFYNTRYENNPSFSTDTHFYVPSEVVNTWKTVSGNWTSNIVGHITAIV